MAMRTCKCCSLGFPWWAFVVKYTSSSLLTALLKGKKVFTWHDAIATFLCVKVSLFSFTQDYYGVPFPGTTATLPGRDGLGNNPYSSKSHLCVDMSLTLLFSKAVAFWLFSASLKILCSYSPVLYKIDLLCSPLAVNYLLMSACW